MITYWNKKWNLLKYGILDCSNATIEYSNKKKAELLLFQKILGTLQISLGNVLYIYGYCR